MITVNAQLVGLVSFTLLILLEIYILINPKAWAKSGRVAMLWIIVYFLFLYVIRGLSFLHIGTIDDLRAISGYATVIPLLGVIIHLFIFRNTPVMSDAAESIDQARMLLNEAKLVRTEAMEMLMNAQKETGNKETKGKNGKIQTK